MDQNDTLTNSHTNTTEISDFMFSFGLAFGACGICCIIYIAVYRFVFKPRHTLKRIKARQQQIFLSIGKEKEDYGDNIDPFILNNLI